MDVIEKIEKVQFDMIEELGKMNVTDPNYKTVSDNLKTTTDCKVNMLREENTRLNNNAVNDINMMKAQSEVEKLEIERMKVRTERMKIGAGLCSDVIDAAKAAGFCWIAYNGDKVSYAIRNIYSVATGYMKQRRH